MVRSVYKFNFDKRVPVNDIEDSLMLAALAAESLHGRAAMKIEASFCLNKRHRTCIIDAETPIGGDIARILTAFITKGYGEASFDVERTEERIDMRGGMHAVGAAR